MNILILFGQKSHVLNIMRCLADAGVKCHVFGAGKCRDIRFSKYCREYVECPGKSFGQCSPELIEQIERYYFARKIDCIIPGDYATALFLSKIRDRLDHAIKTVVVADAETLQMLDHKWKFSQFLKAHSIPQPQTFLAENLEQFRSIPVSMPCAVKALEGGGRWRGGKNFRFIC